MLGIQFVIPVKFYPGENDCLTLLEYGLWPATPKEPRVAFDLKLMEWAEVLFLEAKLSTKSFCNSLNWIIPDMQQVFVSFS